MRLPALALLVLCLSVPATAQTAWRDPVFVSGAVAAVMAPALDQASTRYALDRGYHEANPIMRPVAGTATGYAVQAVITGAVVLLAARLYPTYPKAARMVVWLVAGATVGVAMRNWSVAK